MLTKNDIKQIANVVDERLDVKLEEKLEPIRKDLGQIIDEKLEPVKKDLKILKKDVKYLKKTVDIIVANYDEADVKLERRVRKIEQHLALEA